MKKNEIALLILVASISAFATYFTANLLLGGRTSEPVIVESAVPISAELQPPSKDIFNTNAINPTVPITIGGDTDNSPFQN